MSEFKEGDHFLTNGIVGVCSVRFPCVGIVVGNDTSYDLLYKATLLDRSDDIWFVRNEEMRKIESEEELLRLLFLDKIGKLT